MLIAIGLFLSVVILLLIGYAGELISGSISKASDTNQEETSTDFQAVPEY